MMTLKVGFLSICLLVSFALGSTFAADGDKYPLVYKTVFGVFLHDRGFASDKHEGGVDPVPEHACNHSAQPHTEK